MHGNNTIGPVWSFNTNFSCGSQLLDYRDDNYYNTVTIGEQCWFAENINIGSMITGSVYQFDNGIIEKYCYDDDENNCTEYGGLYQWNEMMQYTTEPATLGICPHGWHIPTDNEWKYLEGTVDSLFEVGNTTWNLYGFRGEDAGGNIKEIGTTHWASPNSGATNSYEFGALPGGYNFFGDYYNLTTTGYYWCSSAFDNEFGMSRHVDYDTSAINRDGKHKPYGKSVRCIKYYWQQ